MLRPDSTEKTFHTLIDPQMPIPAEVTRIHGITDQKVRGKPTFAGIAEELLKLIDGCDFAGFNLLRFDLPLLRAEFNRVGHGFVFDDVNIVDAHVVYQEREKRDLAAAMKFYCNADHDGAHSALEDVRATRKVLAAQIERYDDLHTTAEGLSGFCRDARPNRFADSGYWFVRQSGDLFLNKSKQHKGERLRDVAKSDPNFLAWLLTIDVPDDTKAITRKALEEAGYKLANGE